MDFLAKTNKPKIIRTTQYGDQEFSRWELEILHTPIVQRLYNLKQLGFTDRVYPDAVHSRFNHVLGVAEVAGRMAKRLVTWLQEHGNTTFSYAVPAGAAFEQREITGKHLARLLKKRTDVIRLVGLLHDLTHAAFGHTLEDEVSLFDEKHDDQPRQGRFFDALVAQLIYIWFMELHIDTPDASVLDRLGGLEVDREAVGKWADEIAATISEEDRATLSARLRDLELAMLLLSHIEFVHQTGARALPTIPTLLAGEVAVRISPASKALDFVFHRDTFLIDMVGNTICADLLDYARRDSANAGLKVQFDERLIRYLATVSVAGDLSPTRQSCIRLAIQFFTDKMRHDVLSEMSAVLKARYLINERVLFHPTKCAAGAMLGSAVQLLGMAHLPPWMQALGDQEFLAQLKDIGDSLATVLEPENAHIGQEWQKTVGKVQLSPRVAAVVRSSLEEILRNEAVAPVITPDDITRVRARVSGARQLLWRLSARRYPKLAYRQRVGLRHSGGEGDDQLAERYCNAGNRYKLEREIEVFCNLPPGSVVIHCPTRKTSMKVAEVLVVGSDLSRVAKLRDVASVSPEGLEPYQDEILAIERMYRSIWQLHVYLDYAWFEKQPVVESALFQKLGFPNDQLLLHELASEPKSVYTLLARDLRSKIADDNMPAVIARLDQQTVKFRHARDEEKLREIVLAAIAEVTVEAAAAASLSRQMDLPGV